MNRLQWSQHLASIAEPVLADTPLASVPHGQPAPNERAAQQAFIDTFTDELGHHRAVDRPILAHLLGLPQPTETTPDAPLDRALWSSLQRTEPVDAYISAQLDLTRTQPGPLIGDAAFQTGAIEANTETELGALHALAHLARAHATRNESLADQLAARCMNAARWHVDTLQPDNGTNHPWAVHVFIELAETDPAYTMPAVVHAEGLLHNALVRTGRPDRFSACLLLDASRYLAVP